jgi:anti-sigma regulatory factor (Ser/Thr protein kinase)
MERELMRTYARCDRFAPSTVRSALTELADLGYGWVLGDMMLVASELVSNAVRHSQCAEDQMLKVTVGIADPGLEISVCDPGTATTQARVTERPLGAGGLGLKVVEQLSARWGSERMPRGHRVWAQIPVAA